MKALLSVLAIALVFAAPAFAQEGQAAGDQSAAQAAVTDSEAERLRLAQEMQAIWPVRPTVESALNVIAETMPENQRLPFKAQMRRNIQFDLLEQESIRALASTYTAEELRAMIAFYGSPVGRSISAKTEDYQLALQPAVSRMMDKALLDTRLGQPGSR